MYHFLNSEGKEREFHGNNFLFERKIKHNKKKEKKEITGRNKDKINILATKYNRNDRI